MTLKIYGIAASRTSRPLWVAQELGLDYEHIAQVYEGGATHTPEFLAINPNGHIPVIDDDGIIVWESMACALYLAERFQAADGSSLAAHNHAERAEILRWTFWAVTECEKDALSFLMHRVAMPEERRKQGVLVEETVKHNLSLPILRKLSSLGFVQRGAESAHAAKMVEQLGVQPSDPNRVVKHLSGGNQQKVAVGKWLPTNADVYLFDEPTKGVDVGAKSDIFRLIGQLASEGKGIIYLSCELNEIIGIADRILVMSYGSVVKELSRAEATQDLILTYASAGEAE